MEAVKKAFEAVCKKLPIEQTVSFEIRRGKTGIFGNKLGGVPYFPKSMEWPVGKTHDMAGKPLALLAQLNFATIPHIPNFPEKGILQFFIAKDNQYGMTFDNENDSLEVLARQDNFRVIYHKEIIEDVSLLYSEEDMPVCRLSEEKEEFALPFIGEYELIPQELCKSFPNFFDYRFDDIFMEEYNKHAEDAVDCIADIPDEAWDELMELSGRVSPVAIGGYTEFTQEDPREYDGLQVYDTCLFHILSYCNEEDNVDILWGDSGTGNFFISGEDLKNLNFTNVLYNYDCG